MYKPLFFNSNSDAFKINWSTLLTKKIEIASMIEKKISIDLSTDKIIKNNLIGQRSVAWIRVIDVNNVFRDFVACDLLFISSTDGTYLETVGDAYEVDIDFVVKTLIVYMDKNNLTKMNYESLFDYKKIVGKQIRKDWDFLVKKKIDISFNMFEYEKIRSDSLKRYVEYTIIKSIIDSSWIDIEKIIRVKKGVI